MNIQEHIETAQDFLEESDREFSEGKDLQASEKLWGAASQAVMAAAQEHGWLYESRRVMKTAVEIMAEEYDDPVLPGGFGIAEKISRQLLPRLHGGLPTRRRPPESPRIRSPRNRAAAPKWRCANRRFRVTNYGIRHNRLSRNLERHRLLHRRDRQPRTARPLRLAQGHRPLRTRLPHSPRRLLLRRLPAPRSR